MTVNKFKSIAVTSKKEGVIDALTITNDLEIEYISATVYDLLTKRQYDSVIINLQGVNMICFIKHDIYFIKTDVPEETYSSAKVYRFLDKIETIIEKNQERLKSESLNDEVGF